MKREIRITSSFKKDIKKLSNSEISETRSVVLKLQLDLPLEDKYKDHSLEGKYKNFRECHIRPDLLLIYQKTDNNELHILSLLRINSHSNIF